MSWLQLGPVCAELPAAAAPLNTAIVVGAAAAAAVALWFRYTCADQHMALLRAASRSTYWAVGVGY